MATQIILTSTFSASNLVSFNNGKVVTTSLKVAEFFGKRHKDVLRAIGMLEYSTDFTRRNFAPCFYFSELRNGVKRKLPMYYLTRDGFTLLAMGFTEKKYLFEFCEQKELLPLRRPT